MQVYSIEDGPVHDVWRNMGIPVTLIQSAHNEENFVDWLKYAVSFLRFLMILFSVLKASSLLKVGNFATGKVSDFVRS